ncbi:hypothetical protein NP493_1189g00017 [Ridgeia piscesae]|uniref:Uncharacterized protein n=1 Tax=Ridgeia piscesae TaxID=27915 RepID=A0AAD9KDZ5_RIDPI|nr:hypothetical protein NP493_1189g00017 [Ridgeia piscesae]
MFSGIALPQEVLLEAIEGARDNLTEVMSTCCNVTLDDLQTVTVAPAKVREVPTNKEGNVTSFPEWGYGVVAGGIFLITNIVLVYAWRRLRKSRACNRKLTFRNSLTADHSLTGWYTTKRTRVYGSLTSSYTGRSSLTASSPSPAGWKIP